MRKGPELDTMLRYRYFAGARKMTHLPRQLLFILALGLCACTSAKDSKIPSLQAYESYRELLRFELISAIDADTAWADAPTNMRRKLAFCTAEFALTGIAPEKFAELDAYARDPKKLPVGL